MTRHSPLLRAQAIGLLALGLLLILLGASSSGATPLARADAAGISTVTIRNYAFHPRTLVIRRGTTVRWANHDQTNHTVTANRGSLSISNIAPGGRGALRFSRPGVYRYHCSFHPFMHGTIVIR